MQDSFYQEYFAIEDTHWWFRGRRQILSTLLRRHLKAPLRSLDIGTAGGGTAEILTEFGTVTVCDSDARCGVAARRRGLTFVCAPAESLPFGDKTLDLATAFDVLEHVDDDLMVLREMGRVVRPGGAVAVTVPAFQWMWGRQDDVSGHRRRYDPRRLRSLFTTAGLRVERFTAFNTMLFPPAAVIRLFRRAFPDRREDVAETGLESDFSMVKPGPMNDALAAIFGAERHILRIADLPVGISLFALARRP